jgi:Xaa-Pro aminopeptidase
MRLFDYKRASRLMDAAGIDLILASSRPNVGYLSDYWHSVSDEYYVLWDPSVTHMCLAGIPKDEALGPFLVPGASEMTTLEARDPWIKERRYWGPGYYIQTWREPDPDPGNPIDVAAQALKEKGLAAGRIAVERRYLGAAYYERLRELLPEARLVDAEAILWEMRRVKTPEEIRRIRESCRQTCAVWLKVMGQAYAGMTEKDMARLFAQGFAEAGLDQDRSYCIFGPAGVTLKNGSPLASDNPLREGQFIRVDTQGKYEGYLSNLSRVIGFGKVSPAMESAQALVRDMVRQITPLVKPGVTCAEVRAAELALYEGTGYPPVIPYTGHSLGRVVHEPPYLTAKDNTPLEAGMVVTVEPTVMFSRGGDIFISLEDTLLVTEDGCDVLTQHAPLNLYL